MQMKSLATGKMNPSDKDLNLKLLNKETQSSCADDGQGQQTRMAQQQQCGNYEG